MSAPEQDHIVAASSFELGKCRHEEVTDRVLPNLANVSGHPIRRDDRRGRPGEPRPVDPAGAGGAALGDRMAATG